MTYGTFDHEVWLMQEEVEDEFRAFDPQPATDPAYGGCGCAVSQVYGGDCAHTVEQEGPTDEDICDLQIGSGDDTTNCVLPYAHEGNHERAEAPELTPEDVQESDDLPW